MTSQRRPSAKTHLLYRYDRLIAWGLPGFLIISVVGAAVVLVFVALALLAINAVATGEGGFSRFASLYWGGFLSLFRAGNASGSWHEQIRALVFSIIALLFSGAILGTVIHSLRDKVERLREDGGKIIATDQTVILGWSQLGVTIVDELALANIHRRNSWIVILSREGKMRLEKELGQRSTIRNTKLAVRSASLPQVHHLDAVRGAQARSVIVLGRWATAEHDPDVIAGLLLLARYHELHPELSVNVVAGIARKENLAPARIAAGPDAQIVPLDELVSRLAFQAARQPGLLQVHESLLSFQRSSVRVVKDPRLRGMTFGDALLAYGESTPIGIMREGAPQLLPLLDTVLAQDDELIVVTEPDGATALSLAQIAYDTSQISTALDSAPAYEPESWLFLGWSRSIVQLLAQHDTLPEGPDRVTLAVAPEHFEEAVSLTCTGFTDLQVDVMACPREQPLATSLGGVDPASLSHILVLTQRDAQGAPSDERTLVTRLELEELLLQVSDTCKPVIVTELSDERFRAIAPAEFASEMLVGSEIVALLFAQLSEDPRLLAVFTLLLGPSNADIRIMPGSLYVVENVATTYATVVAAARSRDEIAIGYRLASGLMDRNDRYGVHINPAKDAAVTIGSGDEVIVIARS